jgi:outer membrane protein assembly factor BamB
VMGNNILILTDNGELVLIAADPAHFRQIGRTQVCGNTWCNPAYANGNLYLRDSHNLWCIRLLP